MVFFCILFLSGGFKNLYAQDIGKLWVVGNNVQVIYSTLNQYENGVVLDGWTRVKVTVKCPSCDPLDEWELRMFARTDGINHSGTETGVDDINFSDFRLDVNIIGSVPNLNVTTPYYLEQATPGTSDGLVLISSSEGMGIDPADSPFEFEFTISYRLPSMQNKVKENALFFTVIDMLLIGG